MDSCHSGSEDSVCHFKTVIHDLLSVVQGIIEGTAVVRSPQDSAAKVWRIEQLHLIVTIADDREPLERESDKSEAAKDPETSESDPRTSRNNQSRNAQSIESVLQPGPPNSPLENYELYRNDATGISVKHKTAQLRDGGGLHTNADDQKNAIIPDQIAPFQHDAATEYSAGDYQNRFNNGQNLKRAGSDVATKIPVKEIARSTFGQPAELMSEIFIKVEPMDEQDLHFSSTVASYNNSTSFVYENEASSVSTNKPSDYKYSDPLSERVNANRVQRTICADGSMTCASCNVTFKRAEYLNAHRCRFRRASHRTVSEDGSEGRNSCGICSKTFKSLQTLKNHKMVHLQYKPYACTYCDMSFSRNDTLRHHVRTHTGEKPFSCMYCNKSFTQKSYLRLHKRVHTGEKPYTCPQCNRTFSQKCNLDRHVSSHGNLDLSR